MQEDGEDIYQVKKLIFSQKCNNNDKYSFCLHKGTDKNVTGIGITKKSYICIDGFSLYSFLHSLFASSLKNCWVSVKL